jgi:hypothetical protein
VGVGFGSTPQGGYIVQQNVLTPPLQPPTASVKKKKKMNHNQSLSIATSIVHDYELSLTDSDYDQIRDDIAEQLREAHKDGERAIYRKLMSKILEVKPRV